MKAWIKKAVEQIVADLSDRKGLSGEWDQIDDDIKEEIYKSWERIIQSAAPPAPAGKPREEEK